MTCPRCSCGSEGTLAVICRARLRLLPRMPARVTALLAVGGLEDALALVEALRRDAPSLCAADFMLDDGLDLVLRHRKLAAPLRERAPAYVLAECAAPTDPTAELSAAVEAAGVVRDAAVADDTAGRAALWALREALPEAIAAAGIAHKLDVGVPAAALAEFAARVRERIAAVAPGARVWLFGHLGDGNVHVNVVGPEPGDEAVDEAVLRLAAELGGTISAEHGVGVAKARWIGLTRARDWGDEGDQAGPGSRRPAEPRRGPGAFAPNREWDPRASAASSEDEASTCLADRACASRRDVRRSRWTDTSRTASLCRGEASTRRFAASEPQNRIAATASTCAARTSSSTGTCSSTACAWRMSPGPNAIVGMPARVKVGPSKKVVCDATVRGRPSAAIASSVAAATGSAGPTKPGGTSPRHENRGGCAASHGSACAAASTRASISASTRVPQPSASAWAGTYWTWHSSVAAAG